MRLRHRVKLGGQVPGTRPDDISTILKAALDLPIQLVQGYKGTADITMAAEAGELGGAMHQLARVKKQLAPPV